MKFDLNHLMSLAERLDYKPDSQQHKDNLCEYLTTGRIIAILKDYAELKAQRDALEARVKQLEWDSVFIPKDIEAALAVMGVALPESKEEFNFSINRWVQRLVDRVIRFGPELDAERNNLRAEGAIAVRNAIVIADDGTDVYEIATEVAAKLRAGEPS